MSKKLTSTQQRWPKIEQECYASISAIEHWHHHLYGRHFIIESDHKPLESFTRKPHLNDKCERWHLKLQAYDFAVHHINVTSNNMPDYLSRSPIDPATNDSDDDDSTRTSPDIDQTTLPPLTINMVTTQSHTRQSTSPTVAFSTVFAGDLNVLKEAQQVDSTLQHIITNINDPPYKQSYVVSDGLLMHHEHNFKPVPCAPKGYIHNDILKIYHDTPANGTHSGRDKTIKIIRARYFWDTMNSNISNYIKSCFLCDQNNPIRRKPAGHLQPIEPPAGVWELLAMDFHGPITPISRRGNRYIICLTDILSKFVTTKAVRDCTAHTAARFLPEEVIWKYGTPKCLLTDNGTHFTSSMMTKLLQRFDSTMDAKIASLLNHSRSDWDDQLQCQPSFYYVPHSIRIDVWPFTCISLRSSSLSKTQSLHIIPYEQHQKQHHFSTTKI